MKIAEYFEKLDHSVVRCCLCPHRCYIKEGETGICGVRENQKGILVANTYGRVSSYGIDPVEKKPLFHFYPGKKIASFGSYGCNFKCQFCQNHHISQQVSVSVQTTVQSLIKKAMEEPNNIGIAATYNEPTIQFEFLMDLFELNRKCQKKNVVVTNGFIEPAPLSELANVVDAFNVDLKGFSEEFYSEVCKGHLKPVLENIAYLYDRSHLELTLLLIPGLNDDPNQLEQMFKTIESISPDIPLHISKYFPNYQLYLPETSMETLTQTVEMAKTHLNYVYMGNVPSHVNITRCKSCGYHLIERSMGHVNVLFQDERCPSCGRFHHIPFD